MALGQLVVKLGLDAAEYTQGLSKAELQARRFGETIGDGIRTGAIASAGALVALGGAALAANAAFNKLLDGAAKFQDLSEETGASAVSIAGLSVAAATAGVQIESVSGAMNKLTKSLVGVDDESKAAGSALSALGINIADFKALDPAAQYDAVSKSLAGFADGAGKTAVAMALFGKSGAEQLKVLKALEEQGGATNILTEEQIALADQYRDAQAKLTAELGLYASALATNFIAPMNALREVLLEAIKGLTDTGSAVSSLGANNGVQAFAEGAGRALASLIDYVTQSARELKALVDFVGTAGEIIGKAATFDLSGARKAGADFRERYGLDENGMGKAGQAAAKTFVQSYNETLAAGKRAAFNATDPRRVDLVNGKPTAKPVLNFNGAEKKGKKDNSAAQEAKAQLASDLDAIKNAQEVITNQYANQERILEALRSAGLKDETQYYAEKQRLLAQTSSAQEDALQKQIARLQKENLTGKDAIDNNKKIADAQAKLTKVQEDAATQAQVLTIQQRGEMKKLAQAFADAEAAAKSYLDVVSRAAQAEIAGVGKGTKARDFSAGISAIDEKTEAARQALQRDNRNGKFAGRPEDYARELALLNSTAEAEVAIYKAKYSRLDELQKDWRNGASEAFTNYATDAANAAKQMEDAVGGALKGLEDQLVDFVTTGKFNFKSLADSILKDLARMSIKQGITGPLAGFLGGAVGGGGKDELGDFLKSSGVASGGGGSNWLTSLMSLFGKAAGGNVNPGQMVRVNENGPELLDYQGKQFLMNGNRNARITSNGDFNGGGGFSQSNTFVVQGRINHDTETQLANKVRRQTNTAAARFA